MSDFGHLISGFRIFRATKHTEQRDVIKHLVRQGVKPKTMFITCSDLRISPDTIFNSNPGDFFVFRNMAALIPPYEASGANGVIAGIEYAVCNLEVENIIVLGHANCDAIKELMSDGDSANEDENDPIKTWLSIAEEAKDVVIKDLKKKTQEEKEASCEQESILVSLKNLITYPFIEQKIADDSLKIYGWHFDIESGELLAFNPETKFFDPIG